MLSRHVLLKATISPTSPSTKFTKISREIVNMFALNVADKRGSVPSGVITVQTFPDIFSLAHPLLHQLVPVQGQVGVTVIPVNILLLHLVVNGNYWFKLRLTRL